MPNMIKCDPGVLPAWIGSEQSNILTRKGLPVTEYGFRPSYALVREGFVLGEDNGVPVLLQKTGEVVALEGDESRSVNTSLERFLECAVAFAKYEEAVANAPEDQIDPVVHELGDRLRMVEPTLIRDEASYWAMMLEQVEDGLL